MAATIRDQDNAARTIRKLTVRDTGTETRVINTGRVRDAGNVQRLFFTTLAATVTPATVKKTANALFAGAPKHPITPPATIDATGGRTPYTFAWVQLSGDAGITIATPTDQATTFDAAMTAPQELNAVFKGTVTDADGATASGQVDVTLKVVLPV